MALHEQSVGATDEWYTPPHVFEKLGCKFHTDVASPGKKITPWIPADYFTTKGNLEPWCGFIWMNPPFGGRNGIVPWLKRFFYHGNGIALTPDRTSTPWWQQYAAQAHKVLFVAPKLKFIGADGKPGASPAQGTTLMAVGSRGVAALHRAADNGLGVLMAVQPVSHDPTGVISEGNDRDLPDIEMPRRGPRGTTSVSLERSGGAT